jgi:hypothetical protein
MRHARRVRARWLTGATLVAGVAGLFGCHTACAEQAQVIPTRYERKVTTMEEACNLRKNLSKDPKGIKAGNSKAMQGPNAPYAEGSFSSAAYREKASSELRRRQEQAFADSRGTNAVAADASAQVPQEEARVLPAGKALSAAKKTPAAIKAVAKAKAP